MKFSLKNAVLVGVWAALYAILWALLPESFGTMRNFETIVRQTVIVGLAALGMTFVIIAGLIDLSVGSLVALVTVVIALGLKMDLPPGLAALLGIGAAVLGGFLNGLVITRLQVSAFIVTLASLLAFRGIAKGLASEQKVDAPLTWLSDLTASVPKDKSWMLLPTGAWILVGLTILSAWILRSTVFGRRAVAVGSNEATARLCGIDSRAVQVGGIGWRHAIWPAHRRRPDGRDGLGTECDRRCRDRRCESLGRGRVDLREHRRRVDHDHNRGGGVTTRSPELDSGDCHGSDYSRRRGPGSLAVTSASLVLDDGDGSARGRPVLWWSRNRLRASSRAVGGEQ